MNKKEIRKQLEKELATCDIKDANNIDSSDNLKKAVELFIQLGDDSILLYAFIYFTNISVNADSLIRRLKKQENNYD